MSGSVVAKMAGLAWRTGRWTTTAINAAVPYFLVVAKGLCILIVWTIAGYAVYGIFREEEE